MPNLNRYIQLQQGTKVQDQGGGFSETFAFVKNIFADVEMTGAQRIFVENQEYSGVLYKITVRYQSIKAYFGGGAPMAALGNFRLTLDIPGSSSSLDSAQIVLKVLTCSNPDIKQGYCLLECISNG